MTNDLLQGLQSKFTHIEHVSIRITSISSHQRALNIDDLYHIT